MTTVNRQTFRKLLLEDLDWLMKQPRTLERDHIESILSQSDKLYALLTDDSEMMPVTGWSIGVDLSLGEARSVTTVIVRHADPSLNHLFGAPCDICDPEYPEQNRKPDSRRKK